MKKLSLGLLLMLCLHASRGQAVLSEAQAKAKKENKLILLNFSGSDWCIPCIQMQTKYFEDTDFIKMADSQLVILRADFPRKKKNLPAPSVVKQNEVLADKFNPGGSFPLTLLMDADLNIIRRWDGNPEEQPGVFIAGINQAIQQYKKQ